MFSAVGFLVNFCIPFIGIASALFLIFVRRLRFLASYAFFVPMLGSWCAFAGLIAVGTVVAGTLYKSDPLHSHNVLFTASLIFGFGAGAVLGCLVGTVIAFAVNRVVPWLSQDLPLV